MCHKEKLQNLKAEIVRRNIKFCQLAKELSLYPSTLSLYLNGWVSMPLHIEQKIRERLLKS